MEGVGFEPRTPKRMDLQSIAFDTQPPFILNHFTF